MKSKFRNIELCLFRGTSFLKGESVDSKANSELGKNYCYYIKVAFVKATYVN